MAKKCINGRVNPNSETKLKLFADSAGYCNKPNCDRYLFSDDSNFLYNIGEMAHIIAASDNGPRADKSIEARAKANYCNLILLCPSCHTEVDKAPNLFPSEEIFRWKKAHRERITRSIEVPKFDLRIDAREYIVKILRTNRTIFNLFNPNLPYHENPQAEEAEVWKRKMITQIIPNNQKVLLFLELNYHLLSDSECLTLEHFRQHIDDLIEKHIIGKFNISQKFPIKMEEILND